MTAMIAQEFLMVIFGKVIVAVYLMKIQVMTAMTAQVNQMVIM